MNRHLEHPEAMTVVYYLGLIQFCEPRIKKMNLQE